MVTHGQRDAERWRRLQATALLALFRIVRGRHAVDNQEVADFATQHAISSEILSKIVQATAAKRGAGFQQLRNALNRFNLTTDQQTTLLDEVRRAVRAWDL